MSISFDPTPIGKILHNAWLAGYRVVLAGPGQFEMVDMPFGNYVRPDPWYRRLKAREGDVVAWLREYGSLFDHPPERE